jgi:hypothetical protein
MRRSTVLSLPPQLVFPALSIICNITPVLEAWYCHYTVLAVLCLSGIIIILILVILIKL